MRRVVKAVTILDQAIQDIFKLLISIMVLISLTVVWMTKTIENDAVESSIISCNPHEDEVAYEDLVAMNPDVIGWIQVDGTSIHHPILQGEDNSAYLNKNAYGEFSLAGSIFLDYRNHSDFSDPINNVYGHNINNTDMFADVKKYLDESFFRKHESGILTIGDKNNMVHFIAAFVAEADDPDFFDSQNGGDDLFYQRMNEKMKSGSFQPTMSVTNEMNILLLSTCISAESTERAVLIGLIEENP